MEGIAQADTPIASWSDDMVRYGRPGNTMTAEAADPQASKFASVRSYSTRFQLNEDPISEGGKWINGARDGIDWYNVITKNGVAYGAVSKGDYTDPTALLTGAWGKNQTVKAKVFSRNQTEKYYQEVEIRLRSTLTRASLHGVRGVLEMPEDRECLRGNCEVEREGGGLDFAEKAHRFAIWSQGRGPGRGNYLLGMSSRDTSTAWK